MKRLRWEVGSYEIETGLGPEIVEGQKSNDGIWGRRSRGLQWELTHLPTGRLTAMEYLKGDITVIARRLGKIDRFKGADVELIRGLTPDELRAVDLSFRLDNLANGNMVKRITRADQ